MGLRHILQAVDQQLATRGLLGAIQSAEAEADAARFLSLPDYSNERYALRSKYVNRVLEARARLREKTPEAARFVADAYETLARYEELIGQTVEARVHREEARQIVEDQARYAQEDRAFQELLARQKPFFDWMERTFDQPTGVLFDSDMVALVNIEGTTAEARHTFEQGVNDYGWHITLKGQTHYGIARNDCLPVAVPPHLYHTTDEQHVDSILRDGLRLSRGEHGYRYPPRVYVAPTPEAVGKVMKSGVGGDAVLEIDTTKVPGLALCLDPMYGTDTRDWMAAYVEQPIPPDAVHRWRPETFQQFWTAAGMPGDAPADGDDRMTAVRMRRAWRNGANPRHMTDAGRAKAKRNGQGLTFRDWAETGGFADDVTELTGNGNSFIESLWLDTEDPVAVTRLPGWRRALGRARDT